MTYEETLKYMYQQLPMYQRQGAVAFKKDLGNIVALLAAMGDPHRSLRCIHIAGTNGKGTTAHLVAAGIQVHGLRVGMYTSPHYVDFRERIKINGELMPKHTVVSFVDEYRTLFEEIRPSFFEMTVAMAFHYFAKQEVDIAVIEVGLGGRLDSTNVITPLLSVITNISYDHQAMLGDTLPLIAAEKAGIIKQQVPVVIGEYQKEVAKVFAAKAEKMNASLSYADKNTSLTATPDGLTVSIGEKIYIKNLRTALHTGVQRKNLMTSLYTLYMLRDTLQLQPELIARGIADVARLTYYIGRYQVLQKEPLTIADSAHNIAGVEELLSYITNIKHSQLHIVIGMVTDKDISKVLNMLPIAAKYYFVKADIPRGLAAEVLRDTAALHELHGHTYPTVADGYRVATDTADCDDLILVMGSIFVVAEVLAIH